MPIFYIGQVGYVNKILIGRSDYKWKFQNLLKFSQNCEIMLYNNFWKV